MITNRVLVALKVEYRKKPIRHGFKHVRIFKDIVFNIITILKIHEYKQ
jgi:hypothetical protein